MNDHEVIHQFGTYLLAERCVTRNTHLAYSKDIEQLCSYLHARKVSLADASVVILRMYLKHLHHKQMSARSISRKISVFKLLFSYSSERHGWNDHAKELLFPKLEKTLPRYLSEQEIEAVLEAVMADTAKHSQRNRVMIYLLYVSGMRVTELTQLQQSHIRFDERIVSVQGKGGKQRLIPIPRLVIDMIQEYIQSTSNVTSEKNRSKYLFPVLYRGTIRPISRQSLWGIVGEVCVRAGIKRHVSPHQLRHSLATHMLQSGVNLRSLQLLLGHENLSTVQIYTHVDVQYLRRIYDKKHPRS